MRTVGICIIVLCLAPAVLTGAHPIMLDGYFDDWDAVEEACADPEGDAADSGIDFRSLSVTNDSFALFLRVEFTQEILHHDGNAMVLWIDADCSAATGYPVGGLGAELEWRFGSRIGVFHGMGADTVIWSQAGMVAAPCYAASALEVAIDRRVRPDGVTPLFPGNRLALLVQDAVPDGDAIPCGSDGLAYEFDDAESFAPVPIRLDREAPTDLRVATYNVWWDNLWNEPVRAARILRALQPDIVAFQEIFSHDAASTVAWMAEAMSGTWYAERRGADLVTVSRYPIVDTWIPGTPYGSAHAIALPGDSLIMVVNFHLPWGLGDAARQGAIDAIMAFLRDSVTHAARPIVPRGTPMLLCGDSNMLGDPHQVATLLQGDIADNETFGPDFGPDWDESSLEEIVSRQPNRRLGYTTYDEASPYGPAYIDRFALTGSVAEIARHFILHTPLMSDDLLTGWGLDRDDTRIASDHLPHVVDMRLVPPVHATPSPIRSSLGIVPNPARPGSRIKIGPLETGDSFRVFDCAGRLVSRQDPLGCGKTVSLAAPRTPGVYLCRWGDGPERPTPLVVLPD